MIASTTERKTMLLREMTEYGTLVNALAWRGETDKMVYIIDLLGLGSIDDSEYEIATMERIFENILNDYDDGKY